MAGISSFRSPHDRDRYLQVYDVAMEQCPPPMAALDVDTRHGTTRVYRYGRDGGPPIVLLPALMAGSACNGPLIPALAEQRPVYAVDTLGEAGRSVQSAPFEGIADRAAWLDDVLEHLHLPHVHLVGASTGGWHAVNQAIHAPDRVASISILDPTTVTAGFSWPVILFGAMTSVLDKEVLWRRFLRWSAGEDIMDRPDARLVLAGIRHYRMRVPFQRPPADDEIRSIRPPVLAMFGRRSVVHDPLQAADRLRGLLPRADVEILPDAGHYLFLRPDDRVHITDRVLEFVGRHDVDPDSGVDRPA